MRVYVATRFDHWSKAAVTHLRLHDEGHEPTSAPWVSLAADIYFEMSIYSGRVSVPVGANARRGCALEDLRGIEAAEALLVLVPDEGGCGMWVELGYGLALGKRVLLVGPALARSIFCELGELFGTVDEAIAALEAP